MKRFTMVGIDVSKLTFDAEWCVGDRLYRKQFANDESGYLALMQAIPKRVHVVMEVTGTYHLRLATKLHEARYRVSVENPAKPAYYARMKLMRSKTDKIDAGVLRQYGEYEKPACWRPAVDIFMELNQLDRHIVGLQSDLNRASNRLEGLDQRVVVNAFAHDDLIAQCRDLKDRIKRCEKEIERLVMEHFADLYQLIRTVPGVGKKTAIMFIVLTEAFTRFPDAKRFTSYLGMTSFIRNSGTSVRGSGTITRMGNGRMRQLLYMAALTAKRQNLACQTFAARLTTNGKPPKVVRIAVANKLIRQVFAVIEKQQSYAEKFA